MGLDEFSFDQFKQLKKKITKIEQQLKIKSQNLNPFE